MVRDLLLNGRGTVCTLWRLLVVGGDIHVVAPRPLMQWQVAIQLSLTEAADEIFTHVFVRSPP